MPILKDKNNVQNVIRPHSALPKSEPFKPGISLTQLQVRFQD